VSEADEDSVNDKEKQLEVLNITRVDINYWKHSDSGSWNSLNM